VRFYSQEGNQNHDRSSGLLAGNQAEPETGGEKSGYRSPEQADRNMDKNGAGIRILLVDVVNRENKALLSQSDFHSGWQDHFRSV